MCQKLITKIKIDQPKSANNLKAAKNKNSEHELERIVKAIN